MSRKYFNGILSRITATVVYGRYTVPKFTDILPSLGTQWGSTDQYEQNNSKFALQLRREMTLTHNKVEHHQQPRTTATTAAYPGDRNCAVLGHRRTEGDISLLPWIVFVDSGLMLNGFVLVFPLSFSSVRVSDQTHYLSVYID